MKIIAAHKYVSPRARPLTPEESDVRRIAYALKVPTPEACATAARDLAPLLDAAEQRDTALVLMPVPASTGSVDANRQLANAIAAELHRRYARQAHVRVTVGRKHPVESSCARRLRHLDGLTEAGHVMVRLAGPLTATGTAYYFIDNMATTGTTLAACRHALGFGDAAVWADAEKQPRLL
ncbi:MAG: hypothetical protein K8T26_08270 [Lentisphaerae bacterium]|nr:hypothetical protein [Lentisphaerota bacterium]